MYLFSASSNRQQALQVSLLSPQFPTSQSAKSVAYVSDCDCNNNMMTRGWVGWNGKLRPVLIAAPVAAPTAAQAAAPA